MEYTPLVLEGIENKVKKLLYNHNQLVEENKRLSLMNEGLETEVVHLKSRIAELENDLNRLKVAKFISGEDTFQARQQVNELLREIDKCYSLLNR